MTLFNYINENLDKVKVDVKNGLMPCSIISHFTIYSRFDYYRKLGNPCCDATIYVCNDFQVSESTVFRIIKKMESEWLQ